MRDSLIATLLASAFLADALAAPVTSAWWDKDFAFRVPVTVQSGFYVRRDLLIRSPVDFSALLRQGKAAGALDPNSIRVVEVDTQGKAALCPSQFNASSTGAGELCWTMAGKTPSLAERRYFIYFDTSNHGLKPKPEGGKVPCADAPRDGNLVKNAGFEDPDPADERRAALWDFGKLPPESACRTSEGAHSGKFSLKIVSTPDPRAAIAIAQRVPVKAGKRYLVRAWVKFRKYEGGTAGVWVWYGFDRPQKDYGNYKTSAGGRGLEEWTRVAANFINVYDARTKENRHILELLPDTTYASISPSAYYGEMTVYIDDVEFIEQGSAPPSEPPEVTFGPCEAAVP